MANVPRNLQLQCLCDCPIGFTQVTPHFTIVMTPTPIVDWALLQILETSMSDQHEVHHHHHEAAKHLDSAAKHHREAAKHAETGDHEAASHHAHLAHGHGLHASEHAEHAAKKAAHLHSSH
jgi:hypothetical protein